ncbi:unnamed protein product [Diatraea saccharalis]|uniref:Peptidase S1 domain-containing protein n=1 Tax=Diatraea saccharalis TaxID=40085 RepID=A0A9P0C6M3_9NEOP|nr:unnamed protein product [Diatraea saccharalis]
MIKTLCALLIALAVPSRPQQQEVPISPCPNVFQYEPPGTEPGRWYGNVNLSTDSTLHSLWLNIVLDRKADILGNWIGDVTTTDNIDFKIENTKMMIHPGPALAVRFFVQYNTLNPPTPKLKAIRLNGREICNADNPLPAVGRPEPGTVTTPVRPKPPTDQQEYPVFKHPVNSPSPSDIGGGESPPTNNFQIVTRPPARLTPRPTRPATRPRPRPQPEDDDNNSGDRRDEVFQGGLPTFIIPDRGSPSRPSFFGEGNKEQEQCGKVMRQNPNPLVVGGSPTYEGEWPWQIALYQSQTVDNKYICGGTLVSHQHVVTAAHCVTLKGSNRVTNKNTLTVYLGKHNLRTSVEGVQIRLVSNILKHPEYNASSYQRDLAILELRERVSYTEWVQPACLWPDNDVTLSSIVGKRGSVVGWGFDDTGVATEELSLVEMPVVDTETCIRSYSEFFVRFTSEYTYCAGYKNGTSVCNGDSGGGMVFRIGDAWYLRGIVSLSVARQNEYRCDPSHYVVFTDVAKFLPWIRQNIV